MRVENDYDVTTETWRYRVGLMLGLRINLDARMNLFSAHAEEMRLNLPVTSAAGDSTAGIDE